MLHPQPEEVAGERRVGATAGMARPRFEVDRSLAVDHFLLELGHDRAAGDDLLGEEVGAAHENADLGATRNQRRHQDLQHCRGRGVVDAAGEQQLDLAAWDRVLRQLHRQAVDHRAPEHEAAERADVAAALPAFKDEAARAFLQEQRNQIRRGHMQEGRHAGRLQPHRLVGPAARDDRVVRPERRGAGELLVEQRLRREAEQADAPRTVAEQLLCVGEQLVERCTLEQCERDHRQGAAIGNRGREIGAIGDPGHRSLHDWQAQPQRAREGRILEDRSCFDGSAQVTVNRLVDCLQHGRQVLELLAPRGGEAGILPNRQQAVGRIAPAHGLRTDQWPQPVEPQTVATADQGACSGMAGTHEDPEVFAALAVTDRDGFTAGEVADQGAQCRWQLHLVHEKQLAVEHAPGNADGAASSRDVRGQAPAEIQRQTGPAEPLLEQDEATVFTDVAASLVSLQQQAIDERERRLARVRRAHFSEDLQPGATQRIDVDGACRERL